MQNIQSRLSTYINEQSYQYLSCSARYTQPSLRFEKVVCIKQEWNSFLLFRHQFYPVLYSVQQFRHGVEAGC
jgi:hypothetical protein